MKDRTVLSKIVQKIVKQSHAKLGNGQTKNNGATLFFLFLRKTRKMCPDTEILKALIAA